MNRTPPATIRRKLRKEVEFACPISGCNSPYLSYHHFDPPWKEQKHHNVEGMIALCLGHHKQADAGAFTKIQLNQLKSKGKKNQTVRGGINWRREDLLIIAGSNIFFGSPTILESSTQKFIWFDKNKDGFSSINMDLFSSVGQLIFAMRDNNWITIPNLEDVDCPPSANRLKVRSKSNHVSLDLKFFNKSYQELGDFLANRFRHLKEIPSAPQFQDPLNSVFAGFSPPSPDDEIQWLVNKVKEEIKTKLGEKTITVCELNLKIMYPTELTLTPMKLQLKTPMKGLVIFRCCLMGSGTVIQLT